MIKEAIKLTESENGITNLLQEYANYYNQQVAPVEHKEPIELRITGGWVRDKLLGHDSHDIDVGIDHLSGTDFVEGLKEYLDRKGSSEITHIHQIKKNPEKSKHLETCTTRLLGSDIDFVNLRSEQYTEDSRIPTIQVGTPVEDAYRRDATLNSLFYNIATKQVEDWTGKGVQDLEKGILRTPLEPKKTFLDDPLRCLRLIRFASTFGFKIDPEALQVMKQEDIKDALERKISRERVGVEFEKMLLGAEPLYGLSVIKEVGFGNLFGFGQEEEGRETEIQILGGHTQEELEAEVLDSINEVVTKLPSVPQDEAVLSEPEDRIVFYLSLLYRKWGNVQVQVSSRVTDKKKKKKMETMSAVQLAVLQGLRMSMKTARLVSQIVEDMPSTQRSIANFEDMKRSELANKFILPFNSNWRLNLQVNYTTACFDDMQHIQEYNEQLNKLLALIKAQNLEQVYSESVKVSGREIIQTLNRKPGPWMSPLMNRLFEYQLDHPGATKEDLLVIAKEEVS